MPENDPTPDPLTLAGLERWIQEARGGGATDDTPVFVSVPLQHNILCVAPVLTVTNWPVVPSGNGFAAVPAGQENPTARPAVLFFSDQRGIGRAWGLRFQKTPQVLYVIPSEGVEEFIAACLENGGDRLYVDPVSFPTWGAFYAYLEATTADKVTPGIVTLYAPPAPFDGVRGKAYELTKYEADRNATLYRFRLDTCNRVFGEDMGGIPTKTV